MVFDAVSLNRLSVKKSTLTLPIGLSAQSAVLTGLQKIDPRARIGSAIAFALVCVLSQNIAPLIAGVCLAAMLACYAKLKLFNTLKRVVPLNTFMLYLLIFLPFSLPGDSIAEVFGFHASREGLERATLIALKANAVVLMLFCCVSNLPISALGSALCYMRVPAKLIQLLLFTVRYLSVIHEEYQRLRRSMRARSFVMGFNWHTWKTLGCLIGMLLVRSIERSERILNAMKCRGYQGQFISYYPMNWQLTDWLFCLLMLLFLCLIAGLNFVF